MSISTELYRSFYGVGLHLSFSKAAQAAGVSQSAISQSVKQLERELSMTLFERTTKSVMFTREGKELFETVAKAFSVLDNGVAQLQERVVHDRSSLRLAASDTLCRHFLLPYFKLWQQEYADIGLQITNRPSPQCVTLVRDGQAQLAVVNLYEDLIHSSQLEVTELAELQDIFVGGPRYKASPRLTPEELLAEPTLLLEQGAASRRFFDELLPGTRRVPAFELGSMDVLIDLVQINMGIALVPKAFVADSLASGALVEVPTTFAVPPRKVGLVRSRLQAVSGSAAKFIDLLKR